MSLNRQEKSVVIDEISAEVSKAGSIIIAEYRGLDVSSATVLRKNAREAGVYLRVLKNTLAIRALKGTAFECISEQLKGPLIYAISEDSVAPAKVLHQFSKQNPNLIIVAGALPNSIMGAKDVEALASLPSREELIAKLMGTMQAPVSQFVRTLNEVPTKFVRGLAAVRDKQSA